MKRRFESLTAQQVLALAVHVERANTERFRTFADVFRQYDDAVAARFEELAKEEEHHEHLLVEKFRARFDDPIPEVREIDVQGVVEAVDMDDGEHLIFDSLEPHQVFELAYRAEHAAQAFYLRAAAASSDEDLAALYRELAEMEDGHQAWLVERLKGKDAVG